MYTPPIMVVWILSELKIHRLQHWRISLLKKPITRKLVSVQTVNAKCGEIFPGLPIPDPCPKTIINFDQHRLFSLHFGQTFKKIAISSDQSIPWRARVINLTEVVGRCIVFFVTHVEILALRGKFRSHNYWRFWRGVWNGNWTDYRWIRNPNV